MLDTKKLKLIIECGLDSEQNNLPLQVHLCKHLHTYLHTIFSTSSIARKLNGNMAGKTWNIFFICRGIHTQKVCMYEIYFNDMCF